MVGNFQFTAVYRGEGFTINKAVAKYGDSCSVPTYTDKPGALIFITKGRMKLLDREGVLFTEMLPGIVPAYTSDFLQKEGAVLLAKETSTYFCISHTKLTQPVNGSVQFIAQGSTVTTQGSIFVAKGSFSTVSNETWRKNTVILDTNETITAVEDSYLATFYIED